MCVIIYAPIGTKFDMKDLRDAFDYNDDGAGIAWLQNGLVSYSKGYTTFDDFTKNMKSIIDDTSMDRVIHFRITSRGKTSKTQCHPFLLSDDSKDAGILDYCGDRTVLFMNGTIMNQKLITGLNDTASFIIDTLYDSSLKFNNDADLNIIDELTGAKWAIMSTDGVSLVGDFTLVNGLYYSNTYHMWSKWVYNDDFTYDNCESYGKKSKKSRKDTLRDSYIEDYYYDLYGYDGFDYGAEYEDYYGDSTDVSSEDEGIYFYHDNEEKIYYTLGDLIDGESTNVVENDDTELYNKEALKSLFVTDEGKQMKIKNWFDGTLSSIKQLYGGK